MAATGKTPILLYGSTTATNQPSAGNLTNSSDGCEIAINVADKNLFFKDATNTVNTVPIRQSGTSSNGWLSSTDWNTFNNKQPAGTYVTSVTGTAPVVSSGGTTPAISMAAANGSTNGYLTSTDWSTFNSKVSSQWITSGSDIYYSLGSVCIGTTSAFGSLTVNSTGGSTTAITLGDISTPANSVGIYGRVVPGGQFSIKTAGVPIVLSSDVGLANPVSVYDGNLVIGTSGKGIDFSATSAGIIWRTGVGSPEGVVTAAVGSLYTRSDGGVGTTLYVKQSGTGNTGWAAK